MLGCKQIDSLDQRGLKGMTNQLLGIIMPPKQVETFLAPQLIDDRSSSAPSETHAYADTIDVRSRGSEGNFGAHAGDPSDRTNLDQPGGDLRHLPVKEARYLIRLAVGHPLHLIIKGQSLIK